MFPAFAAAIALTVVMATPLRASAEADPPDQLSTQVIAPRSVSAATVANVVRPLLSARGRITVPSIDNVLIVTDTAASLATIRAVVERLDAELAAHEVHIIRIQYADAGYLAGVLNQLFGRQAAAPIIVADQRTNSLLIRGRRSEIEAISRLLQRVP